MVHKIKPRLSAAQRLPSGSHVVEACWEYKFRAHGQVNAPPPSPRAPSPSRAPPGPPRPPGGASAARASSVPQRAPGRRAAWPRVTLVAAPQPPPRAPRLDGAPPGPRPPPGSSPPAAPPPPTAPGPSSPGSCERPSRHSLLPVSLGFCPCFSLSDPPPFPSVVFLGALVFLSVTLRLSRPRVLPCLSLAVPCLAVSLRVSLSNSLALPGCVRPSVRPSASRGLPGSPSPPSLPSPLSRRWRPPHCSAAPAVYDKNIILLLLNNPINLSTGRKLTSCLFG